MIVLKTNLKDRSASEIYGCYKARLSIETFYDSLKNGIDFKSIHIDGWALTQGVAFVMLFAGRIDSRILQDDKKGAGFLH